jgi:superfamily II DNA helicase RecQ
MKLKFFSINALEPEPDQQALDDFCARHRIVSVDRRFVERGEVCYWSVCVTYLATPVTPSPAKPAQSVNKRAQVDYREILPHEDFLVFSKLRSLRKMISEAEGTPLYAIVSNEQMAEMVTKRITTLTALAEINGIGEAKLEKYGKRFLEVLQLEFPSTPKTDKPNETPTPAAG